MRHRKLAGALLLTAALAPSITAAEPQVTRGLVLSVDASHRTVVVSHDSVPGVMAAMAMAVDVRDPKELEGIAPGTMIEFTLVLGPDGAHAEHVRIRPYQAVEQDPLAAERLGFLKEMIHPPARAALAIGETVPDFTLVDQAGQPVTLSSLQGKVVAVNFMYTSCALPQFCFRMVNHFGAMRRRFAASLGKDLVLLTVTFDPVRDQPERLAEYARQWNAEPRTWHFLTGDVPDVARVCDLFGVQVFRDDGLMNHSSRTALIDRQGRLVANIEGNEYTTAQLADLVDVTIARR